MSKSLVDLDNVMECQKKASNFTHDLNFIANGISTYYLKSATNESLTEEEIDLLFSKLSKLSNDLEVVKASLRSNHITE